MLFAAGFGTRMGALTADLPKPLVPVSGKALIDHTLDVVRAYRPEKIVANCHYLPDQIRQHLAGTEVAISLEYPDILETGGGLRAALPLLGSGPVFTMNSDAIWRGPNPLKLLADHWRADDMDALLLCIPKERAKGHTGSGDFLIDTAGHVQRGQGQVYTGLQIIKTDSLASIPRSSFSLNLVWDDMLSRDRLCAVTYGGRWCDVGRPDSIKLAETLLQGDDV